MARSLAELVGFACIAIAAFLLHPVVGFAAAGIVLILAANFGGRLDRVPTVPTPWKDST